MYDYTSHIFSEIYPIREERMPHLMGYSLDLSSGQPFTIGGKLSYRLRKQVGGNWTFADSRLITDKGVNQRDIQRVIEGAWENQPEIYRSLQGVKLDSRWSPSAYANAHFASNLINAVHQNSIWELLSTKRIDLGKLEIERVHEIRPWVVRGLPTVSISISSRLKYKQDLHRYLSEIDNPRQVIGLWAADKNSTMKGEISDIVGSLGDHRKRLLHLTQTPETMDILEKSADDTLIVSIGRNQYEYAATCLWPIIRPADYSRFEIQGEQVNKHLRMHPADRYDLVMRISRTIASDGWLGFETSTASHPHLFLNASNIGFNHRIRIGNGSVISRGKDLLYKLKEAGLYRYSSDFNSKSPIRAAIVTTVSSSALKNLCDRIERELSELGFGLEIVATEILESESRVTLEKSIDKIESNTPDVIIGVFPRGPIYYVFKKLTIGRGIASQVVLPHTLEKSYAVPNIVLGILGKTGNVPFVLENPLPFADIIVGIDVAREKKKWLSGTVNIAAIARIYFSDGQFIRYVIHDEPIEGETIPSSVLESMFPASEFSSKRVIIHRDSYFRGGEEEALKEWGSAIGATIHPVEVIKSGTPRLYGADEIQPTIRGVDNPATGSAFLISPAEAVVVSTLPPGKNSTAQPLRVRTRSALSIENALQSVLSLTLLHYGSINPPRLPVTIHYSDKIAGLALKGVKPKALEGDRPYWL